MDDAKFILQNINHRFRASCYTLKYIDTGLNQKIIERQVNKKGNQHKRRSCPSSIQMI